MTKKHGQPVLHCEDLVKDFGGDKGVFGVGLTLRPGEIVGFVGPNGAGKSTTINMLTGLTLPNQGTIQLFGERQNHLTVYRVASRMGMMFSEFALDETLTAEEVFVQSQELLGKDCSAEWRAMSALLELDITKTIKQLSLGNRKKVVAVHALMHQPELIIMDEPTSGMDPIIKERFLSLIKTAVESGAGVMLSSHDLAEIQEVADRIVMIKAGKIILDKNTQEVLTMAKRVFQLIDPPAELRHKIEQLPGISQLRKNDVVYSFSAQDYEAVTKLITASKFYNFYIEKPGLEDAFREFYE